MLKTLEKLQGTHPAAVPSEVFLSLREALTQKQEQASQEFFQDDTIRREVLDALRQAARKLSGLPRRSRSFSIFEPNLKEIYRRARQALRVARRQPSTDHFHELRKEVKAIWYHTRLLEPIWPGVFAAYGQELGRLGELLGEDHDFGVLAQEIESGGLVPPDPLTKGILLQVLEGQRTKLQEQIHPLASRVLAPKAPAFIAPYRLYWKLWQAEARNTKSKAHQSNLA